MSLNRQGRLTRRLIQIQLDKQAVLEASRQTKGACLAGCRAVRPTGTMGDRQTDQLAGSLVDKLADRQAGQLADRRTDQLAGW